MIDEEKLKSILKEIEETIRNGKVDFLSINLISKDEVDGRAFNLSEEGGVDPKYLLMCASHSIAAYAHVGDIPEALAIKIAIHSCNDVKNIIHQLRKDLGIHVCDESHDKTKENVSVH